MQSPLASAPTLAVEHAMGATSTSDIPTLDAAASRQASAIEEAEHRGLSHMQQVLASGEGFDPISHDDSQDESAGSEEDAETLGPLRVPTLPPASSLDPSPLLASTTGTSTIPDPAAVDPFYYPPAPPMKFPTPADIHPHQVVYIIYLLVFWLHAQCHLPFRACNAVLVCFGLVLRALGTTINPPMYTTLPSIMSTLGADPVFQICPVCPVCMEVFPASSPASAICATCN